MGKKHIQIVKSNGEKAPFSSRKLRNSLKRSGAGNEVVDKIINKIHAELYPGISTRELYNRAYALLRKERGIYASKYKLKKALYEFGPTGFPFERFVAQVLSRSGYKTEVGQVLKGKCVSHEVDVLGEKDGEMIVVECKFHSDASKKCDVKVPLYIHSRFKDLKAHWDINNGKLPLRQGWVATNTQFTSDAIAYGRCAGLILLSWDYPKNDALKDRIDRNCLYPVTVSTLLSAAEKNYLLGRDVVLLRQLLEAPYLLDHLGMSEERKKKLLKEAQALCNL